MFASPQVNFYVADVRSRPASTVTRWAIEDPDENPVQLVTRRPHD